MSFADFKFRAPVPSDNLFEEHAKAVHYAGSVLGLWSMCSWPPADANRRNAMYALAEAALGMSDLTRDDPPKSA